MIDIVTNPLVLRAAVVGVFGGVGLSLACIYSRRGPLIFPVYAAVLAALAVLLGRDPMTSFKVRVMAALVGFTVATLILYITVIILAKRHRESLVAQGRLAPNLAGVPLLGHVWRWALLLGIGTAASAAVAFVSG